MEPLTPTNLVEIGDVDNKEIRAMLYWEIGLIVAVTSVMVPTAIGTAITRRRPAATLSIGFSWAIVYACVWACINWSDSSGFYGPIPYGFSLWVGCVISMLVCFFSESEHELDPTAATAAMIGVIAIPILILGACIFPTSSMWGNAQEKAMLIGQVKQTDDLAAVLSPADTEHICLVDEEMAKVSAQTALSKFRLDDGAVPGSRYEIGKPTKQFVDGQFWWIFPLEFQGWLKWRQSPVVPGFLRVSAEDPYASAEPVQTNKKGEEIRVKYLNSACWEFKAERHLRYNGYFHQILTDWTFEVDDDWNPYYTVSVAERQFGFVGLKVTGVVVLNLQTGEHKLYDLKSLPAWIDRAIPLDVIDYNLKKWGKYHSEGLWYTLWHNDKSQQPTPGWYLTFDQSHGAQWFTGFTSMNSGDQAMTGFTVTSSRDMSTTFCRINGVTEAKAYDAAKSLWSNFAGYTPAELVPYNIDGNFVYVIGVRYEGQYKGVSLVSMENPNVAARGTLIEDALANYRSARVKSSGNRLAPAGGALVMREITGIVDRVGLPIFRGQDVLISFTLKDVPKRFVVTDSFKNPEAPLIKPGDEVTCQYLDTKEPIITIELFDINGLTLSDENPAQSRLIENEKAGQGEVERVQQQQDAETLLKSDRAKGVDPKALKQFLEQQTTK